MSDFIVVAGQSNAQHMAQNNSLEIALSKAGVAADVVHVYEGSTTLVPITRTNNYGVNKNDWDPRIDNNSETGELFDHMLQAIDRKISSGGTLRSLVWIQGESEAGHEPWSRQYNDLLTIFEDRVRSLYGQTFNFTIVQLADQMPIAPGLEEWTIIQTARA